jgi:hypothetical protein
MLELFYNWIAPIGTTIILIIVIIMLIIFLNDEINRKQ